jgi:glutathione S-transferase
MLKFYHAPRSRSSTVHWLLEELGVAYEMELIDITAEGGAPEAYRDIQPHKKVPAIVHGGVTITERAAIFIYLNDVFPQAGLAPRIGDRLRGPYLSWLTYVDAVLDPVLTAKAHGWSYAARQVSFGTFDDMIQHVEQTLLAHPYVLGDRFTAADIHLGNAMHWAVTSGMVPDRPAFRDYVTRIGSRPVFQRVLQKDGG